MRAHGLTPDHHTRGSARGRGDASQDLPRNQAPAGRHKLTAVRSDPRQGWPLRLGPETRAAIAAALAGGRILNRWFGRVGPVRLKSARDPVTRADVASERAIGRLLARRFPGIGFVGEESGTVATGP